MALHASNLQGENSCIQKTKVASLGEGTVHLQNELVYCTSHNLITLQKQDGYFNTKCFTSVACVVTHSCN